MPTDVDYLSKRIDDLRADVSSRLDGFQSEIAEQHSNAATISQSQQRTELSVAEVKGEMKTINLKLDVASSNTASPAQIVANTAAIVALDVKCTANMERISKSLSDHLDNHKTWENRRYDLWVRVVTSTVVLNAVGWWVWATFFKH